mgnify:CR=1 FL=1
MTSTRRNRLLGYFCAGWLVAAAELPAQVGPANHEAAFEASVAHTKQSYHWDHLDRESGEPSLATSPRAALGHAPLTTLQWDPVTRPDLYQQKVMGSVTFACALVVTYTDPYGLWNDAPGTEKALTYEGGDGEHFIFPWVTSGNDLRSYLVGNYFLKPIDPPASSEVALRITQALGLEPPESKSRGLGYFWVPLEHLARPAYSADIGIQLPPLETHADGTFQVTEEGAPFGFRYGDFTDDRVVYTGVGALGTFVAETQARTEYP